MSKITSLQSNESIIEFLEDGFLQADTQGIIVMANEKIAQYCNYSSSSELLGLSMTSLYANSDARLDMLNSLNKSGKLINYEVELKTQDGKTFWTLCNIKKIYDKNGKFLGTEGLIRDITESKRIKKENETLAKFPAENPFPVLRISSKGVLLYHNKASQELLNEWNYFEKMAIPLEWQNFAIELFQNAKVSSKEVQVGKTTLLLTFAPIVEMNFINIYANDISDRIEYENNLRNLNNQLSLEKEQLHAANQQLKANEQQLRAANQQLRANEQQLRAANQQLAANDQQFRAANQQLTANEQQLRAANQQLSTTNKQLTDNELKLTINEKRFEQAQETGQVGNWEYNLQTTHFWASKGAKRIYGFDIDSPSFTTEEVEKCIPERKRVHQTLIDLIENDAVYDIEFDIITRDNRGTRTIHSMAILEKDTHGNPLKVSGVIHDISQRKRSEEKIESLSKFPEQNPFPVLRISNKGDVLYYNNASKELLNKWEYFKNYLLPDKWKERTLKAFKENIIKTFETKVGDKTISLKFAPISEKEFINVYGIDISDRVKAENKIKLALKKAEEADQLKSAFLANMSHEIRTPMNGILGFTDLLLNPKLSGSKLAKYVEIIQKSGERMLNTVNALIDISKIETGQESIYLEKVNFCQNIRSIHEFFENTAREKGLKLELQSSCKQNDKIIKTDLNKLNSIITNLIRNAIKYTDTGSIVIGSKCEGSNIVFWVKDTGIGIPKHRQNVIFDRFIQADISDKRALQGSGLGLTIVKAYSEMLNGEVWLESKKGKGSCFYVKLPINMDISLEVNSLTPEQETASLAKNIKVIIAEDDDISYQHLSIIMEPYASTILHAKNGLEAVSITNKHNDYDVILMDIEMPEINGYEATRRIREFNKDIIIIAQTAYALQGDREKAIEAGCNDYITKPIDEKILIQCLEDNLS